MPFFWFWNPPTSQIPLNEWLPFRAAMWFWVAVVALAAVGLLTVYYRWRIGKFKIRQPADPFRVPPLGWWLLWLFWAALPAAALGTYYFVSFRRQFTVSVAPTMGAITAALVCWAITLVLFQLLLWVPGITPLKFLYHPRWPWRLGKPSRRVAVVHARSATP